MKTKFAVVLATAVLALSACTKPADEAVNDAAAAADQAATEAGEAAAAAGDAATAAAEPPEEPPGVSCTFDPLRRHGLTALP